MNRRKVFVCVLLWIAAIGGSMSLDALIATAARNAGLPAWLKSSPVGVIVKIPGEYWFTAALAVVATYFYARRPKWHGGAFVLICGLLSGINGLIKWMTGRARPFKALGINGEVDLAPFHFQPFFNGLAGLFGTKNLCFPSGHAALAFANAGAMAILFPRFRWAFFAIASLTAAERFLETAHYFSDTVAAAALGIGGAHLLAWIFNAQPDDPTSPSPVTPGESQSLSESEHV